jgi:hypothetical protein
MKNTVKVFAVVFALLVSVSANAQSEIKFNKMRGSSGVAVKVDGLLTISDSTVTFKVAGDEQIYKIIKKQETGSTSYYQCESDTSPYDKHAFTIVPSFHLITWDLINSFTNTREQISLTLPKK